MVVVSVGSVKHLMQWLPQSATKSFEESSCRARPVGKLNLAVDRAPSLHPDAVLLPARLHTKDRVKLCISPADMGRSHLASLVSSWK